MLQKNNEKLIRRYFEEVWNNGKLDVLDEIISPDYINHSPGMANPVPGSFLEKGICVKQKLANLMLLLRYLMQLVILQNLILKKQFEILERI